MVEETGEQYGDRAHILYVNGSYKGENPLGLLMADFRERNPGRMHYAELAERVSNLKNSEDEVKKMCRAMEITFEEGVQQGNQTRGVRDIKNLMETLGLSLPDALKALKIPPDEQLSIISMIEEK